MSELTTEVSSGMSTRSAILRSESARDLADSELAENELELLDERAVLVLAQLRERGVEAESGLDAHGEDVECVRKLAPHLLAPTRVRSVIEHVQARDNPTAPNASARATAFEASCRRGRRASPPRTTPTPPRTTLAARNPVGENVRASPDETSLIPTRSSFARGSKRTAMPGEPFAVAVRQALEQRIDPRLLARI